MTNCSTINDAGGLPMGKYKDDFDDNIKSSINEIGEKIYNYRVKNGLNPNELSKRAGITRGYLLMLETGLHNPSIATLCRIANGLGLSPGYLLPDIWISEVAHDNDYSALLPEEIKAASMISKLFDESNSDFRDLIELMKKVSKLGQRVFQHAKIKNLDGDK